MFLIGGPAFSGKTLLAHLLNQEHVLCLDEPGFHAPDHRHRGIDYLQEMFPQLQFPAVPVTALSFTAATNVIIHCGELLRPRELAIKEAGHTYLGYARTFKEMNYPVICIVRDIRDVLAEASLPPWLTEDDLNRMYNLIWENRELADLQLKYEQLVTEPDKVLAQISDLLGREFAVKSQWTPSSVQSPMLKLPRHQMLKQGRILTSQVGIWESSEMKFSETLHTTAATMGY